MPTFFTYMFLGVSLSAPVGPITAAQLEKGARFGFLHAWLIGIGAMCADILYMLLIYFGLAHFLSTPFMKVFLWLFGCFVLVYTGIETLINQKKSSILPKTETGMRSFRSGFFIALLNPLNILFWLGIYGSILAQSMHQFGYIQLLWHTLGIFLGIFIWDVAIALFASSFHKVGNQSILQVISTLAACSLIGFGIYFGYQALLLLLQ
ncbi:LysE family transporter [Bacillus horti]|uniref:Threonine/homoserine/homoserine lactone efflux protein n=1 Tax=Caldalkalibacillus horti TaxID=77523 RepID=A0ABT9VY08_9BACI|nr:LysE family transporter [Bacillus horti]MDQ0165881.1 threonine/homoserine/homoserine lactone efflux protein [Bacillus horti]